ncbi:MAG: toll/interleukin-1 receptor domain-containing protein, partial [Oscillospiraceae bacterium]|nr:toll/interleukin-1 receptor domain-containing protein [Oscillospiraceae bacterium]
MKHVQQYAYTAFISYRHKLPDEAIAKKLHTLIEGYSIPKDVRASSGRRKMGRVFRDQEELPLSTDLGGDIKAALDASEWLIAVCSPDYLQSKWCMTEMEYFISIGRRDRILTVLANGEPDEAFPPQLRFIRQEGRTVEIEPLAADVRGASVAESLKKLAREKLRILAPILGVSYDQLRQRARRRKIRTAVISAAVVIALLGGFLTYALMKNAQISAQNEQIKNQNEEIVRQNEEISEQRDIALNNQMQVLIEQANISVAGDNKLPATKMLTEAAELRETVGEANDEALYSALEASV